MKIRGALDSGLSRADLNHLGLAHFRSDTHDLNVAGSIPAPQAVCYEHRLPDAGTGQEGHDHRSGRIR